MDEGARLAARFDSSVETAFVEVMFARSTREATTCCDFLKEHQIPARISDCDIDEIRDRGLPILVPGHRFVCATEVLAFRAQDDDEDDDGQVDETDEKLDDADDEDGDQDDIDDDGDDLDGEENDDDFIDGD